MAKTNYTYDNYAEDRVKKLYLPIANSRGRKPVLRSIAKARKIINDLMIEINPSDGKESLKDAERILTKILSENI